MPSTPVISSIFGKLLGHGVISFKEVTATPVFFLRLQAPSTLNCHMIDELLLLNALTEYERILGECNSRQALLC